MKTWWKFFLIFAMSAFGQPASAERGNIHSRGYGWNPEYDKYIADEIRATNPSLLECSPEDFQNWCGKKPWSELTAEEKINFYNELLFKLAEFESSYNSGNVSTENFKDSTGKNVESTGLLQISTESSKNYGCNISKGLKDPETNLKCGVRIMAKQICESKTISKKGGSGPGCYQDHCGAASYWSPFRKEDKLQKLKEHVQARAVGCGGTNAGFDDRSPSGSYSYRYSGSGR